MARFMLMMIAVAVMPVLGSTARAGGPPPMYVVVDRVIMEPTGDRPDRITIWGSFIRQKEGRGSEYSRPVEGFISLNLDPKKAAECRKEWKRWEKAAGTTEFVAVGMCGEAGSFLTVKIHESNDRLSTADATYTPGHLGANDPPAGENAWADQPPVKELLAFVKKQKEIRAVSPPPRQP